MSEITIYTLPNCVQCDTTKKLMDRLGLDYTSIDLSTNQEAAKKVMDMGYKQAPVVVAGETHWGGFQYEKITGLASTKS